MTDIASALAAADLGEHEGDVIASVGIEIPGAAGGLRDALAIEPVVKHRDDEVLVLIRGRVGKIRYDPIKDTDTVSRVHVLIVEGATLVEGDVFEEALAAQHDRIIAAREAAAGVHKLPWEGDELDALAAAHEAGEHKELTEGCPACDEEHDLDETERRQSS